MMPPLLSIRKMKNNHFRTAYGDADGSLLIKIPKVPLSSIGKMEYGFTEKYSHALFYRPETVG